MRAMILAGGQGRRLLPYTTVVPKPLFPVGEVPIIDLLLRQLDRDGFDDVVISLGHLGELIQAYLQAKPPPARMRVQLVRETEPLGTAGALRLFADSDETVLVANGDLLTDFRFDDIARFHEESAAAMTVAVQRRALPIEFGVVESDGTTITAIREKPEVDVDCCMGINVYGPEAIGLAMQGSAVDFPDVVEGLLARGRVVQMFRFDGFWRDLGRGDDLLQAQIEFERHRSAFLPDGIDARG
jgi:NDP-sugar pyrophosphorylase family protein